MQTTQTTGPGRVARLERRSEVIRPDAFAEQSVNVPPKERMASALAGGVALAWGLSSRSWSGKAVALLGSGLVYRGVSGRCPVYGALGVNSRGGDDTAPALQSGAQRAQQHYDVLRSATVQKSAEQVYGAWRDPETFRLAMSHFAVLTPLGAGHVRWTLHDPLGRAHHWETELVADEPNRMLRWATAPNSLLIKSLTLTLAAAPGDRGTEMKLHLRMERPAGALGSVITKLLGAVPTWVVDRALGNIKSLLEAGELPTLKNTPAARRSARP